MGALAFAILGVQIAILGEGYFIMRALLLIAQSIKEAASGESLKEKEGTQ